MYDVINFFSSLALLTGCIVFSMTFYHISLLLPGQLQRLRNYLFNKGKEEEEDNVFSTKAEGADGTKTLRNTVLIVAGAHPKGTDLLDQKIKYDDSVSFASTVDYDESIPISDTDESLDVLKRPFDTGRSSGEEGGSHGSGSEVESVFGPLTGVEVVPRKQLGELDEILDLSIPQGYQEAVKLGKQSELCCVKETVHFQDEGPLGFILSTNSDVEQPSPQLHLYVTGVTESSQAERLGVRTGGIVVGVNDTASKLLVRDGNLLKKTLAERPLSVTIQYFGKPK